MQITLRIFHNCEIFNASIAMQIISHLEFLFSYEKIILETGVDTRQ